MAFASGLWVALVTPMTAQGEVDDEALKALVERHVEAGTAGLVPCGTTGESATLDHAEHEAVIATVIEAAAGRLQVMAGTGSNSTREAIKLTRFAQSCGATGALVITPYYNKPTQAGLIAHFEAVAAAAPGLPICLYNVPGRTGVDLLPETAAKLAELESVVAIKEATGSVDRASDLRQVAPGLDIFSGDDSLTLPLLSVGAKGVISVVGNVAPALMVEMLSAWERGDVAAARASHERLYPLMKALFVETNPIPVKASLGLMGAFAPHMRLPLVPPSEATLSLLRERLGALGLL